MARPIQLLLWMAFAFWLALSLEGCWPTGCEAAAEAATRGCYQSPIDRREALVDNSSNTGVREPMSKLPNWDRRGRQALKGNHHCKPKSVAYAVPSLARHLGPDAQALHVSRASYSRLVHALCALPNKARGVCFPYGNPGVTVVFNAQTSFEKVTTGTLSDRSQVLRIS